MEHKFICANCKQEKIHISDFSTGYGINQKNEKICFDCCGKLDRLEMQETKKAVLYLCPDTKELTNWCGTLRIKINNMSKGFHNIARTRYDVWFYLNNKLWHGTQYGENTQLCHCKQSKA